MKSRENKVYQTPYGEVNLKRYLYQSTSGGKGYIPLEYSARILRRATPKFGKMLSQKYARMSASEVLSDLSENHSRHLSKKYLQRVAEAAASVAQHKEAVWEYALPELDAAVETVMISLDGAMLPTREAGWRESMVGTISLYDNEGERLHSIYIGEAPEYGKASFMARMESSIQKIKVTYPKALYIGIADGAKSNWPLLEKHTTKQLIDFYHATEYLAQSAYAAYPEKTGKRQRSAWLDQKCHQLKHDRGAVKKVLAELSSLSRKHKLTPEVKKDLTDAVRYFKNNQHRMNYASHTKHHWPIGSGVTEAACKTLIKQRFCQSGMRWKQAGIKTVLRLRELVQTTGRWQQFWEKINQYGLPCLA